MFLHWFDAKTYVLRVDFALIPAGFFSSLPTSKQIPTAKSERTFKEGLATHSAAKLATHVLLASHAPQFLIKDIPSNVKVGGVLWGQLTTAAAKIEAQTPGRVPNMTYAEVIAAAESLPARDIDVKLAQREVLKEWGLANGLLPVLQTRWTPINGVLVPSTPEPTESQMEQAIVAYNSRMQALVEASTALYTPLASRKEIALDCLKAEFPTLIHRFLKPKSSQRPTQAAPEPAIQGCVPCLIV